MQFLVLAPPNNSTSAVPRTERKVKENPRKGKRKESDARFLTSFSSFSTNPPNAGEREDQRKKKGKEGKSRASLLPL